MADPRSTPDDRRVTINALRTYYMLLARNRPMVWPEEDCPHYDSDMATCRRLLADLGATDE